ncbi:MAG: LamB/YcsF family protein [Chloroflexi bacterium]|nr:LamB/YcsF family protein [Chloroflexota bacterium]
MRRKVDFNCDLGEGFGAYRHGYDEQLMPYISSANIACGFHAGDPVCMHHTVMLAEKAGVAIGAHPGFPDLMGFGRRDIKVTPEEAQNYIIYQLGALQAFTRTKHIQHVKPHGALYNMGATDEALARAAAEGVREVDQSLILVGLAGSAWLKVGKQLGLRVASEVFADRALNPDGSLVPRSRAGAVIEDLDRVISNSLRMVVEGKATAIDGTEIAIQADSICLHSDTPGAVELARALKKRMEEAGVEIVPMARFL